MMTPKEAGQVVNILQQMYHQMHHPGCGDKAHLDWWLDDAERLTRVLSDYGYIIVKHDE